MSKCMCGSGQESHVLNDARGIPLGMVCSKCEEDLKAKVRPEVLTDSNYYADEPIEPEE